MRKGGLFMRKLIVLVISFIVIVGLSGCESDTPASPEVISGETSTTAADNNETSEAVDEGEEAEEYSFSFNGNSVKPNQNLASAIEDLGEGYTYFESPSCAFQGLDMIYTYTSFVVRSYNNGQEDVVGQIELMDDLVKTTEGIGIGDSVDDVIATYGEATSTTDVAYIYVLGDTSIRFNIEGDLVTGITYERVE